MSLESSDIEDQSGSNAEVACLSEKVDMFNLSMITAFTVLSYNKLALLIDGALFLSKDGYLRQNTGYYVNFPTTLRATTLTNVGSTKLVVLCDNYLDKEDLYTPPAYSHSLLKVFSIENDKLRWCFDMKTAVKKTDKTQQMGFACGNENLAIFMTNPLKLELLNTTTCVSESVNMTSFVTDLFPVGDEQPFLSISNSAGQTHVYISLAAGGGMRKLTKIDTKGHILATFSQFNDVKPGPIAAVGDGTFVFGYDQKLLLMSEDLQILATLESLIAVNDMRILNTKKGRYLYCLEYNKISQFSLQ